MPSSGNDLYFHVSAPKLQSWIAVGFGRGMSDTPLIFVAYRASNGKDITVSPRIAHGHTEPKHDDAKDVSITVLPGSGIDNDSMVVDFKCSNCRSWSGKSLDIKSASQPMIFASYGEDSEQPMQSDDRSATIPQHSVTRMFSLNLVQATGQGGLPIGPFTSGSHTKDNGGSTEDDGEEGHDYARAFHALLMIGSFLLLFPLGVVYLRIFEKVLLHWMNQAFAAFLILAGAIIGITISIKRGIVSRPIPI